MADGPARSPTSGPAPPCSSASSTASTATSSSSSNASARWSTRAPRGSTDSAASCRWRCERELQHLATSAAGALHDRARARPSSTRGASRPGRCEDAFAPPTPSDAPSTSSATAGSARSGAPPRSAMSSSASPATSTAASRTSCHPRPAQDRVCQRLRPRRRGRGRAATRLRGPARAAGGRAACPSTASASPAPRRRPSSSSPRTSSSACARTWCDVRRQIDELNRALRDVPFGSERYQFTLEVAPEHRAFHDLIMEAGRFEKDSLFGQPRWAATTRAARWRTCSTAWCRPRPARSRRSWKPGPTTASTSTTTFTSTTPTARTRSTTGGRRQVGRRDPEPVLHRDLRLDVPPLPEPGPRRPAPLRPGAARRGLLQDGRERASRPRFASLATWGSSSSWRRPRSAASWSPPGWRRASTSTTTPSAGRRPSWTSRRSSSPMPTSPQRAPGTAPPAA